MRPWIVSAAIALLSFAPDLSAATKQEQTTDRARRRGSLGRLSRRPRGALAAGGRSSAAWMPAGSTDYREYWRGFALWRRVLNGFNETADAGRSRRGRSRRPWRASRRRSRCTRTGSRRSSRWSDSGETRSTSPETTPTSATRSWRRPVPRSSSSWRNAGDNPRALWIRGGMEGWAPPPVGGDLAKASATLRYGVDVRTARGDGASESARRGCPRGEVPENLMNLAYLHLARDAARPRRGPRLRGGSGDGRAGVALRARHPDPADRGASGRSRRGPVALRPLRSLIGRRARRDPAHREIGR